MTKDLLKIRKISWLTPTHQIILLVLAYLASVLYFQNAPSWHVIFAPLYEEVIFRAFLLGGLVSLYGKNKAIWLSAFLFGLWHLKNITFMPINDVLYQMAYTGILLGPFLAWLTLKTKSIWPSVFIHAINNILLSPLSWWVLSILSYKGLL